MNDSDFKGFLTYPEELLHSPPVDMDKLDLDELEARFGEDGKTKQENKDYLRERDRPYAEKVCKNKHKEKWEGFNNLKKEDLIEKELYRVEKVREKDADNIERGVVDRTFKYEEFSYYPTKEDYYNARGYLECKTTMKFKTNDLYQMLLKDELDQIVRYKAGMTEMSRFVKNMEEYFGNRRRALNRAKLPEYEDRLKELKATQAAINNIIKNMAMEDGKIWKYGVSSLQPGDKVSDLIDFEELQDITGRLRELTIEKKSEYKVDYKVLKDGPFPARYTVIGAVLGTWGKTPKYFVELKSLNDGETLRVRASYSLGEILAERIGEDKQFEVVVNGKFFNKKYSGNEDLKVEIDKE